MKIFGASGESRDKLSIALREIDSDVPLYWGADTTPFGPGINSCRRLTGLQQLYRFTRFEVPTIPWTIDPATVEEWLRTNNIVFGRKLQHTQAKDIIGADRVEFWKRHYWTLAIQDVKQEWRFHIFNGKSISRGLKARFHPPAELLAIPASERCNDWMMGAGPEPPAKAREAAKRAVAAVGYDFGAVDVLEGQDGSVYVLEVNRAPYLNQYVLGKYVNAIKEFIAA